MHRTICASGPRSSPRCLSPVREEAVTWIHTAQTCRLLSTVMPSAVLDSRLSANVASAVFVYVRPSAVGTPGQCRRCMVNSRRNRFPSRRAQNGPAPAGRTGTPSSRRARRRQMLASAMGATICSEAQDETGRGRLGIKGTTRCLFTIADQCGRCLTRVRCTFDLYGVGRGLYCL
jgi:hypothetical protein